MNRAARVKEMAREVWIAIRESGEPIHKWLWREELYELQDELDHRREWAKRYPTNNDLIAHINDLHWLLEGEPELIPPEGK